jgi:predicted dehydrogenase
MVKDVVRLGLVGCGRLAEQGYVPALAALDGVVVTGVADPDGERRTRVAAAVGGARAVSMLATLLDGEALDGIVIASPADFHADDAELAAGAGLPTLVEKPPADDVAGAQAIASLDPAPWIAFNRRFDPGARALRDSVAGAPVDITASIAYRRSGWRPHVVTDDALLDLGPHVIDWVTWIADCPVVEVLEASVGRRRATAHLRLGRGTARISVATDRPHAERIEVRNPSGTVVGEHRLGGVVAAVRGRITGVGATTMVSTLTDELAAFATAIRTGTHPDLGTAGEGLAVMRTIDAIRATSRTGRPTPTTNDLHEG